MLSVEFEAKSFFPISPEIKKDGFTEKSVLQQPLLMQSSNRTFQWRHHRKYYSATNTHKNKKA